MGIVLKQSFSNTLILFLGFAIGGINVLFLYTHFLHEDYFGLITFILSTGNILLPLMVFGMNHTVIKFYSSYKEKNDRDAFLMSSLLIPLMVIIPLALIGTYGYETISTWLSKENILIKDYTWYIFIAAIFMGYFEVFYSWTKVQFNSVLGNFIREIFARVCVSVLLFFVYLGKLSNEDFILAVVLVYGARALLMKLYAFYVYMPKIIFKIPENIREILSFSMYIIIAGSASGILLEIDKFMIPQMEQIAEVAYYSVAVYIASVVAIPSRAMQQITTPITAEGMNGEKFDEVGSLYRQTSINLLVVGGLFFLLINLNVEDLYQIIDKPQFTKGVWIVMIISLAKLGELALGTGNAILVNSKYYRIFFYLSLGMAISVVLLNHWLISLIGIHGAALATLIVVVLYNMIKILYIRSKIHIQPFSKETIYLLLLTGVLYAGFYFVDISNNAFLNIALKSVLIILIYSYLVKQFKISSDIENMFQFLKRKRE